MSESFITDSTPAGGFDTFAVSTSVVQITAGKLAINEAGGRVKRAVKAFITVETNSIRVRWDGTNPDASTGHLLTAGSSLTITGDQNVSKLRLIRSSADATVMVTLYYNG